MKQINVFNKGGVSDIDQSLIQNDRFVFPTLNVRLTNYKGKGLVPTTIEGNELAFDLEDLGIDDATIYGAVEYNGVLYMAINGSGMSTIACYPSPTWISKNGNNWAYDSTKTGFENKIAPLITINGNIPLILEDVNDIFNFSTHVEMIARPSYDGSVDLYLADYTNENKVVNTCYNQVPELLSDRLVLSQSIRQMYSHILYASSIAKIELNSLQRGGKNKPGNYFIALRYLDTNFNRTTFSALSRPISVVNTFTVGIDTTIVGVQEMEWLSNDQQYTNSSIVIDIEDVDTNMKYFELAIIRYSSLQENSIPEPDIYLIDKYYDITSTSATITLNGLEQTRLVSIDEIVEIENYFRISNSHQQIADRYIGVNWKSIKNKDIEDAVKDFFIHCGISNDLSDELIDYEYDWLRNHPASIFQYNNIDNIHNKLGYFLDEIYPFGGYVQFKNGYKSKIYPFTGTDANVKGLMQVRSSLESNVKESYTSGFKAVLVNADIDSYLLEHKDNIDSIVIVRGERSGNLVTNGLLFPTYNKVDVNTDPQGEVDWRYFGSATDDEFDSVYCPIFLKSPLALKFDQNGIKYYYYAGTVSSGLENKLALISPDFANTLDFVDGNYHLKTYFLPTYVLRYKEDEDELSPDIVGVSYHGENNIIQTDIDNLECEAFGIQKMTHSGAGRYSSMLRDGDSYDKNGGAGISFIPDGTTDKYYNRSYYTCPYIGIDLEGDEEANDYIFRTASLFTIEPNLFFTNYLQTFNIETTQYKAIATFTYSDLEIGGQTKSIYGGDCFNQLTYLRLAKFFDFDTNEHVSHYGIDDVLYQHGLLLGFNSQNSINMQLRNNVKAETEDEVIEYTYFPHCERLDRNTEDFIYRSYQPDMMFEALQVNNGYNITLPTIGQLGFNQYEKVITNYENRVFVSSKHNSSSYVDAYRKILLDDYKDYELGKGAIIGIYEILGKVCIVQKHQIFEIVIDERVLSQEDNLMIASSSDILSQEVRALSNFGAAHVNHVINTDFGLVGIDVKRKTLWLIEASLNDRGYRYLQAINFGEKLGIQHEFEKLLNANPKRTDVLGISFTDNDNKLVLGYDSKYGELHITVNSIRDYLIDDYEIISGTLINGTWRYDILAYNHGLFVDGNVYYTIEDYEVFIIDNHKIHIRLMPTNTLTGNERISILDAKIQRTIVIHKSGTVYCDRSYVPNRYMNINEDFYGVYANEVHKHNIGYVNTFNGELYKSILSYVVVGIEGEKSYMANEKIFESTILEMAAIRPEKAIFKTDYQYSEYVFDEVIFSLKPQYINQSWYFAIPPSILKYETDKEYLQVNRNMQGRNMTTSIYINPNDNSNKNIFVRSSVTNFKVIGF